MTGAGIVYPAGVQATGTIAVAFVVAIASQSAPTVAELTASTAVTLQCFLDGDFNVSASQNAGSSTRLCDKNTFQIPGLKQYTIDDITYIITPQGTSTTDAEAICVEGAVGFMVPRYGIDGRTTDWVAAQKVDVIPVTLGARVKSKTTTDEFALWAMTQKVFVTNQPSWDVAVAA